MKGPYVIRRMPVDHPQGKYLWALLDTRVVDILPWGLRLVASAYGNNPVCAPERIRRQQSLLNTRNILDGEV